MNKQDMSMKRMSESSTIKKMEVVLERSVSFSPTALVCDTTHITDYTAEEIAACWYNDVELKMIKVDIKTTTLLLMGNAYLSINNNDRRCFRGLESYTQPGQASKTQHREDAIDAALDEQELQWDEGITDPEMIAEVYFERTRQSEATARVTGLSDEETVRNQEQQKPLILQKMAHQEPRVRRGSIGVVDRSGRRQSFSCHAA
jgi:hypothetical protein